MKEYDERETEKLEGKSLINAIEYEGSLPLLQIDNALNDIKEIEELE